MESHPTKDNEKALESIETNLRDLRQFSSTSTFIDIAREISGRLAGNSQILSLNVTNIVILLILKGILYGAALIGTGTLFGGYNKNRKENEIREEEPVISESEILMLLGYLMGETANKYECLNRIACQDPKKASEYVQAAKILLKGSTMLYKSNPPQYAKYQRLLDDLQKAVNVGNSNGHCEELYSCSKIY